MTRRRLDVELVRRGLADSRVAAQLLVDAQRVTVAGAVATKAARLVDPGEAIAVAGAPRRFVSRGGDKLDAALEEFGIDVTGARALDAGSSTGGFTDCLLQRGARAVVAVDVGRGQLHERLRRDGRVRLLERTHVRDVTPALIGGVVDVAVADLSFISLASVVDRILGACAPAADVVLLVKPQFEAGRAEVAKGRGVVSDPAVHERAVDGVGRAVRACGATIMGTMTSPLRGAGGNTEFLLWARAAR